MATFHVTTEVVLERVYTVQAPSEEDAKKMAMSGLCCQCEDSEISEEVQSIKEAN